MRYRKPRLGTHRNAQTVLAGVSFFGRNTVFWPNIIPFFGSTLYRFLAQSYTVFWFNLVPFLAQYYTVFWLNLIPFFSSILYRFLARYYTVLWLNVIPFFGVGATFRLNMFWPVRNLYRLHSRYDAFTILRMMRA